MGDPIRIANCSGFFGDRVSAAREMVEGGPIDVLTGDWLAELTMLILARTRMKHPNRGFARTFVTQMEQVMGTCLDKGIKVVSTAGGLDPEGCAEAVAEVARLVLLTTTHDSGPDDRNGAVLCDADLWILGSSEETYDRYTREVRTEYGHVPEDRWRSGRSAVLRHFLEQPAIFHTRPGVRREPAARANLERELSRLAR